MVAPCIRFGKPACASLLAVAMMIFSVLAPLAAYAKPPLDRVRELLEAQGCSRHALSLLFSSLESPAYGNVALSMKVREAALHYEAFLEPSALAKAREFWRVHDEALESIGAAYEVDPSIIVAILLVESALGERTGEHPVATTLATFALMFYPSERERIWRMLSHKDRARWTRERFHAKLEQRASWALNELRALLTLFDRGVSEAAQWRGSYMGAVGWPQFLPSSLLHYGADGDGDGTVNLNRPEDAFASIAKYLKTHGWRNNALPKVQESVVLQYNNSRPYAQTVLEVARRLRDLRSADREQTSTSPPVQGRLSQESPW